MAQIHAEKVVLAYGGNQYEIGGGGSIEPNIHFSSSIAPTDTSKLWVKTDIEATKVFVDKQVDIDEPSSITTLSTVLPKTGSSMGCGTVGTKIYLIGGRGQSKRSIYCFDTTNNTIRTLSTEFSDAYFDAASTAVGTKIYMFGGYDDNNYLNKILCFDTENETYTILAATLAVGVNYPTCSKVGTKIYIFGGYYWRSSSSHYVNTIQCFDTETKTISTLSTVLPSAVSRLTSAAVGTKIYLFGGVTSFGARNTILCFDTESRTIRTLTTTLPMTLEHSTAATAGTKIYLFGGISSGAVNTILCFDTETETISTLAATLPVASSDIANGIVGNKIYLLGGSNNSSAALNSILQYNLSLSLNEDNLLILDDYGRKSFKLINDNALALTVYPSKVLLGDSNNEAQYVAAALYDESSQQWVEL